MAMFVAPGWWRGAGASCARPKCTVPTGDEACAGRARELPQDITAPVHHSSVTSAVWVRPDNHSGIVAITRWLVVASTVIITSHPPWGPVPFGVYLVDTTSRYSSSCWGGHDRTAVAAVVAAAAANSTTTAATCRIG